MARTFISPSKYIQGPGEMGNLGKYAGSFGKKALVLISAGGSAEAVRTSKRALRASTRSCASRPSTANAAAGRLTGW